jgi:hypothetical protein
MKQRYKEYQASHPDNGTCALCDKKPIQAFKYWKVTSNEFPYDLIASEHHMLVPMRHVTEKELTADELHEFSEIKSAYIASKYDYIIEATPKNKSIPTHFHLHLIIGK